MACSVLIVVDEPGVQAWVIDAVRHVLRTADVDVSLLRCRRANCDDHPFFRWLGKRIPGLAESALPEEWAALAWQRQAPDFVLDLRQGSGLACADPTLDQVPTMSFVSTDGSFGSDRLPFAAEVAQCRRITEVSLVLESPRIAHSVSLRGGRWRTMPERFTAFSQSVLTDIAPWPAQVLEAASVAEHSEPLQGESKAPPRSFRRDARVKVSTFLASVAIAALHRLWVALFRHEQWTIGIAKTPISTFVTGDTMPKIEWHEAGDRHVYLADPFGIAASSYYAVLAERFDNRAGKGAVVTLTFGENGAWSEERVCLESKEHRSYPYLVRDNEKTYVIPECYESGRIVMYEVSNDFLEWREAAVLVERFPAVDGTVFRWQDRWWLLATDKSAGADSHLHAWHADSLTGPWSAHRHNPVKIDISGARPGGTPFVHDGRLYRPAQDCSETYGGRIVLHEVLRLDPDVFLERAVKTLTPPSGRWSAGCHTLSGIDDRATLIDAKREVFSWHNGARNLRGIVRNMFRGR